MAAEKLIASLNDLADAARVAVQDGLCKIRLADGRELLLCPASPAPSRDEDVHDVTDSAEEEVVLSCLRPDGQVHGAEDARNELLRRLQSRGIKPDERG